MNKYLLALLLVVLFIMVGVLWIFFYGGDKGQNQLTITSETEPPSTKPPVLFAPLSDAKARVTKKPFGIFVTPQKSPVQPEKFTGYHTGTDFETTSVEANKEISIYATCSGNILVKEFVSGYGGVIVQSCMLQGQPVTVLYGHIDISKNFEPSVGDDVIAGRKIAVLAPANSHFTDGERKHLHLGIHKGPQIDFRGYVQNQSELSGWLNAADYL